MKNTAALCLALLAGCAAPRASAPAPAPSVRGEADALRVEREYRPQPMGAEAFSVHYDHPPKAYYATCWKRSFYCGKGFWERPRYYRRCD